MAKIKNKMLCDFCLDEISREQYKLELKYDAANELCICNLLKEIVRLQKIIKQMKRRYIKKC